MNEILQKIVNMSANKLNLVILMLISSICAFAYNVSENKAIQVVKEYRALVDGEVASVSKAVQPVSYFKNVTSDNGNVLVSLVCPSIPEMSIVVRSAISESICQRYGLPDGNFEVILNTSILDNGVYLISLYYNNQLLETKQIIK